MMKKSMLCCFGFSCKRTVMVNKQDIRDSIITTERREKLSDISMVSADFVQYFVNYHKHENRRTVRNFLYDTTQAASTSFQSFQNNEKS